MQIRRRGVALLMAAALTVLAGCGGNKSEGNKETGKTNDGQVTITFWHGMDPKSDHGKVLAGLIDQFQKDHPQIKVDASFQGKYTDLEKKLVSAIPAKTQPTVAQVTDNIFSKMAGFEALAPLELPAAERSDFPEALLKLMTVNGKLYGLPFNRSLIIQIYNTKLMEKAPTTWEEFAQSAQKATSKADSRYGAGFEANVYQFGANFMQTNGKWLADDGKSVNFNSAEGVQSLEWMAKLVKDGSVYTPKPDEYLSDVFNDGRVALAVTTSASLAYIKPKNGDPWASAPLFAGPANGSVPLAGANLVIMKGATPEQEKAATDFLLWMTGKEATLTWATGKTGYAPIRKSALADAKWQEFVTANPTWAVLGGNVMERATIQPTITQWPAIQSEITTAVQKVMTGTADAKTALDEAAKKANDLLKK
jgi:ABC-type glycerol-3-phosphate transport system substrate-binding protein